MVPAVGAMLALGAALSAACFVRASASRSSAGRARRPRATRDETDRFSRDGHGRCCWRFCLLVGLLPGLVIDAHGAGRAATGGAARCPSQSGDRVAVDRAGRREPQLLQRPAGLRVHRRSRRCWPSRSSTASPRAPCAAARPGTAAFPIRARPPNTRPTASPSRSGACSARGVPRARAASTCRRRATRARRGLTVTLRDLVWETLYAPIGRAVRLAAEKLNHLQFLTIRQYLSLVFAALVVLLLVISIWT